jgi:peptidoglycan/LPS O-acetylase OafA/YrhL
MATNMAVAMAAGMRFRGHGWATTAEMAAAIYVPFMMLFPPLWLGVLSAAGLLALGHVLMLVAMAAVMLRRDQYTGTPHHRSACRRLTSSNKWLACSATPPTSVPTPTSS